MRCTVYYFDYRVKKTKIKRFMTKSGGIRYLKSIIMRGVNNAHMIKGW